MRWHWIRDQVRQNVFDIYWRDGANNLADFYTKTLAHESHHAIMPYIITSPA